MISSYGKKGEEKITLLKAKRSFSAIAAWTTHQ